MTQVGLTKNDENVNFPFSTASHPLALLKRPHVRTLFLIQIII